MTVIGRDRPGLVGKLSEVVRRHGGNWEESRMAHLAGQFAGILRVGIAGEHARALAEELRRLERDGLTVVVQESVVDAATAETGAGAGGQCVTLELTGQDRPGIVRQISETIARHGANVEELETECVSSPMSGEMLFRATARLTLPPQASLPALRQGLEAVAADLMVDVSLEEPQ
jgi:glycine cleavage system regulatory protein